MNFLITGANGFLGREILNSFLNTKYNLILTNRQILDVSSESQVNSYFEQNKIDVVIHTAIKGGMRNRRDTFGDFTNNVTMFNNLLNNSNKFKLMINFGSGAEFDRKRNVVSVNGIQSKESSPLGLYGKAKNVIAQHIREFDSNIVNMRLFGCFGHYSKKDRFIKSVINNIKNGDSIIIDKNKKMDFFWAQDVCRVIEYYVENFFHQNLPIDINLCYKEKKSLKEIADKICNLMNCENNVIIKEDGMSPEYTGCSKSLSKLDIKLSGFDIGLQRVIEEKR